jgi:hypothetical protein
MSQSQFEKSTIASPYFGGRKVPGTLGQPPGATNTQGDNPSGGYVRPETIRSNGGSMIRSPKIADSVPPR